MEGYKSTITYSSRDLTAKEKIALKDTNDCIKLETTANNGAPLILTPSFVATIEVENPRSKQNTHYTVFVIVDSDGTRYISGSESLRESVISIMEDMEEVNETYEIKIHGVPSKNFIGKNFLTASIVL